MDENAESADSAESVDSAESADSGIDMESSLDSISSDLFGKSEESDEEFEESEEFEAKEAPKDEVKEPEIKVKDAPASWKKEMRESFSALTPDMQDYIEQRESEMRSGLDQNKDDSTLGRSIRDVMSPYETEMAAANVNSETMVKNLMGAHYKLTTAPIAERTEMMNRLAHEYGVQLGPAVKGEQKTVDPQVYELQKELNGLKYKIGESEKVTRQATETRVTNEVNEFAEKHEHFDEVSEQLIAFVNNGDTLESAYEKAVWANPITRQKEMDRVSTEKTDADNKAKMEKVRAAKKAKSTNVSSRDSGRSPTGFLGSMEDTMRDTLRDIQNRT